MTLNLVIATGSSAPIYRHITDQVRLALASGTLAVGAQLPSVRALAEKLVVNPNTVARAYAELARDGLLESRPGRGVFVVRKRRVFTREEGWRRLEPMLDSLMGEAMSLDFTPEQLREAFSKKLARWKESDGGNQSHE